MSGKSRGLAAAGRTRINRIVVQASVALLLAALVEVPAAQAVPQERAGKILQIKRIQTSAGSAAEAINVAEATNLVQLSSPTGVGETLAALNPWQQARAGAPVYWDSRLRLLTLSRARVELAINEDDDGIIVLLPEVRDERGDAVWEVPGASDTAVYHIGQVDGSTVVTIERGALIAVDWVGDRESSFRLQAAGRQVRSRRTAWMLAVDAEGEVTLVVDEGEMVIMPDNVRARPGELVTWSAATPVQQVALAATDVSLWHEAIRHNGDDIWRGGGFPFIVIPIAAVVPMAICAIVPDCLRGDPESPKVGNVGVSITP